MTSDPILFSTYALARARFAELGVDTEAALTRLAQVPVSLHCWQGDDVGGFEGSGDLAGSGLATTGHYPGKARSLEELRSDLAFALQLIPGRHRVNLHACYADFSVGRVDRDALAPAHFQSWIEWAKRQDVGLDFNPTFFAHKWAAGGATLSHRDRETRSFWIRHACACRRIAAEMSRQLGSPVVHNLWIPDGEKDQPIDRKGPRERLTASLEDILAERLPGVLDGVESKLFGIGSESYVVGSHEFYLAYAVRKNILLCLDAGHFHPTETLTDKISAVLGAGVPAILLHLSRGIRWDSDHVVTLDDHLRAIMEEIVRGDYLTRAHLGLDYFDASINRIAAWVIGMRNAQKALLLALLQPHATLYELEANGDTTMRLALTEELKMMPASAVWDEFCRRSNTPVGSAWVKDVQHHERTVLSART